MLLFVAVAAKGVLFMEAMIRPDHMIRQNNMTKNNFEKVDDGFILGELNLVSAGEDVGKSAVCSHQLKFDHAAYYGRWDLYKCTKCSHQELIYWEK
jgi:hypothetical protein